MLRKDLLTGELFPPKRINQVFANPMNRIAYHNKKANELRHSCAYINKPLHTNLRILNELMKESNEAVFHKQFLIGKGYEFGIYTHLEKMVGKNQFAIYNFTVFPTDENNIKVIRND
jgi:hypothetical protein